jgi:hypothetical protein
MNWRGWIFPVLAMLGVVGVFVYAVTQTAQVSAVERSLLGSSLKEPQVPDPALAFVEVTLPPAPLPQLSAGYAGIAPAMHLIRLVGTRPLSNVDPIEHPARRRYGRVDLSFVLAAFLPVALLPLFYALHRRMAANQAMALVTAGKKKVFDFVIENLGLPLAAALSLVGLAIVAALYANGLRVESNESLLRLLFFVLAAVAYTALWTGLFGYLVLRGSFQRAVLQYTSVFLLVSFLVPALAQTLVQTIVPASSRLPLILARRKATALSTKVDVGIINGYLAKMKQPAVDGANPLPPPVMNGLMSLAVEGQLETQIAAMESDFRRLDQFTSAVAWLSPASVLQATLDDLAGTGLARYSSFREQSAEFLGVWRAYMLPRFRGLQFLDYDAMRAAPKFQFRDQTIGEVVLMSSLRTLYLVVLAMVVLAAGWKSLAQLAPAKKNAAR